MPVRINACLKFFRKALYNSKSVVTIGNNVEKLRFSYTGQENKEEQENFIKEREGKKNLILIVGRFSLNRQIYEKKIFL